MTLALLTPPPANSPAVDAAAEANHRIANNLSMISGLARMQGTRIGQDSRLMSADEVRGILEEFGGRLETVARLHRLLAHRERSTPIDIADYLHDIAKAIVSSLSFTGEIRLLLASDPGCLVAPDRALTLGLMVGELVTNAVKYAHPTGIAGEISIAICRSSNGGLVIEISDDGVGLPEGFDPMTDGQLGFRLVRLLAKQLGATTEFNNRHIGLDFVLRVPRVLTS